MPIPVSDTNKVRAGLEAHSNATLSTAGPFARLAAQGESQPSTIPAANAPHISAVQPAAVPQAEAAPPSDAAISTHGLSFCYTDTDGRPLADRPPVVVDMTMSLPRGATCLLIGPNGAGKTTLLKTLGGKHMVPKEAITVLGQPPFHATNLTTSGALSYIGGNWERDVAFAGYSVPLTGDFPASQMLDSIPGVDPARKQRLMEVLDVDPAWRMHLVSDGQRRRVQIAMGLLRPFQVLLLDEITVDLDVLGRADLMDFLKGECRERGATIIYATHIFDGLESWPSHVLYVAGGRLQLAKTAEELPELQQGQLLELVERWLRQEKKERQAAAPISVLYEGDKGSDLAGGPEWNNGWAAGRLTSSMKLASNAVMR